MLELLDVRAERDALLPTRANATDAGLDLRAKEDVLLPKGKRVLVDTGVQVKIPEGYVGLQISRSSLSKQGIHMTNSVGVIDSGYRGNIFASLMFVGLDDHDHMHINALDRITQLLVIPIEYPEVQPRYCTDIEWNDTARGVGGFGSTGTK